jgi:hypothetical protein
VRLLLTSNAWSFSFEFNPSKERTAGFGMPFHQAEVTMIFSKVPEPKCVGSMQEQPGRRCVHPAEALKQRRHFLMSTYDRNPNPRGYGNGGWIVGAIIVVLVIIGLFYWGGSSTNTASNTSTPPAATTGSGAGTTTPRPATPMSPATPAPAPATNAPPK